jgi:hypothetical protein
MKFPYIWRQYLYSDNVINLIPADLFFLFIKTLAMKFKLLGMFLFFQVSVFSQIESAEFYEKIDSLLVYWPQEKVTKCNTAIDNDELSDTEKRMVFYINLARMDGKRFAKEIIPLYVHYNPYVNMESEYFRSLLRELVLLEELPPFLVHPLLNRLAKEKAISLKNETHISHSGSDERFDKIFKAGGLAAGENIQAGDEDPLNVVMSLLVDEGVSDYGHRRNLLDSYFSHIGLSHGSQRIYDYITIMEFAKFPDSDQ